VTQLVRRYDIGGLIAEGGMAEIVAASAMTEAGVSKRVALKRIRTASSGDPQFVARFFDEVRLAMQLSHANVVQVFDFGRSDGDEFFLAMEFVEGVDLQRLRRAAGNERLPPGEALHVVAQMLRGLDYAHRRTDSDEVISRRMDRAAAEISHWAEYDYVLINNDAEKCRELVHNILKAERLKATRRVFLHDFVREMIGGR